MQDYPSARLDLVTLLAAVEDAPPFSAADVLGERLASELDAREVSFLIADFSGHALIRLGHAGSSAATRTQGDETAERVPLIGQLARACARLAVRRGRTGRGRDARVRAGDQPRRSHRRAGASPRGSRRTNRCWPRSRSPPTPWPTSSSPTAGSPTSSSGASARCPCRSPRRSSTACCRARTRARPGSSRIAGWLEPAGNVGGDTFDFALERGMLHFSTDRRHGPRGQCRAPRHAHGRGPAQRAPGRRRTRRASTHGQRRARRQRARRAAS